MTLSFIHYGITQYAEHNVSVRLDTKYMYVMIAAQNAIYHV